MSFNLNTKINNLQFQVNSILAGSVSNPLTSNLNANNKQITNINTVSSVSGSPLNLTAGASTINCASAVNMVNTLTINNNTVNNGLVVADSAGDTSCFVVDQSGNVGIKANPANPINASLFVNGNTTVTNDLKVDGILIANGGITSPNIVSNVSAGAGLTKTGVSTNPTLSITPVGTAGTYAYPTSVTTNDKGQISAITAGSAPVASVTAGTNVTLTGTAQNPIINFNSTSLVSQLNQNLPFYPNGTLAGNDGLATQLILFPNAPGGPSNNLPVVAGGFYVFQGAYKISSTTAGGYSFYFKVANGGGVNDAFILRDVVDSYSSTPIAGMFIPFAVFFQAQSTSIQVQIGASGSTPFLPSGQSINVQLSPCVLWRIS
jgi:hypothetical protein